ncbi:uncharacterized protein si:dkey-171c9.3 [Osmerus mordax]|uniref:uncharacterized protein si:dkey-171c9.3 n=1 Tax=Osmerus mordax TaxID=8014 RepID=UPI00350F8E08
MKAAREATEPGSDPGVPKVRERARGYPDHNSSANSSRSSAALIDGYGQDLARRILQGAGFQGPPEPPWDRESLAGQLASLTLQAALKEASEGGGADGEEQPGCSGYSISTSRNPPSCCPSLPQNGLPNAGSLDYPDAPPTTPLLPEMVKSRDSFTRRLKGGLANEFLPSPSPPPPTPKEKTIEGLGSEVAEEPNQDFVGRLLCSLSLETSERGRDVVWERDGFSSGTVLDSYGDKRGPLDRVELEEYAGALSDEIIGWMTNRRPSPMELRERGSRDDDGLGLAAGRLAEKIVTAALTVVTETSGGRKQEVRTTGSQATRPGSESAPSRHLGPVDEETEPKPGRVATASAEDRDPPGGERLKAYAGRLVFEALSQAAAELKGA